MHTKHVLSLALAAAFCTTALAAVAQPIEPTTGDTAAEPALDAQALATAGVDERQARLDADLDVDRRCLQETGSRVNADPQPATAKDDTARNARDCTIGNGTVHTREDIDRSGATTVKEALQALDPRFF